jgi:microcystin-dependent protein
VTLYRISPPPAWFWFGDNSELLADGTLYALDSTDMVTPKEFSLNANGTSLATQVDFDSQGRLPPIYWSNIGSYYVVMKDRFDVEVLTINDFPPEYVGLTPQDIDINNLDNHVINGQFYFPYTVSNPIADGVRTPIADGGWFFETDNSTSADSVNFDAFANGQTDVEANPPYALRVSSTSADTGETYKRSGESLGNVSSFSGQQITVSAQFKSPVNSTVEITLEQYFGTGGSPSASVEIPVGEVECGTDWQKVTFTIDVPTIEGKITGSAGNDALIILTNYPLSESFSVSSTNYQLLNGEVDAPYSYQTKDEVGIETKAKALPRQSETGSDIGKSIRIDANNNQIWFEEVPSIPQDGSQENYVLTVNNLNKAQWLPQAVPTGALFMWPTAADVPDGYLPVIGQQLAIVDYQALFAVYGTTWGGNGTTTFNLPDWRGRSPLGAGTGSGLTPRTVGQIGGEEDHVLITSEISSHTHTVHENGAFIVVSLGVDANASIATGGNDAGFTGGGGGHNTMHPYAVTNWIVKT